MEKSSNNIQILTLYSLTLPLRYNSFSVGSIEKDNEYVMGLDQDLEWENENVLNTAYEGIVGNQYMIGIKNQYPRYYCHLTNVYAESKESFGSGSLLSEQGITVSRMAQNLLGEYLFSVDNLVAESEVRAIEILHNEITGICHALSIILAEQNCNKHLFHPRVEPDWG